MGLAVAALLGAAAVVVLGTGLDAAAYDAVQLLRTCRLDTLVAPLARGWNVTFACGLATLAWLLRRRCWEAAVRMGVVTLGGALACEWLKLLFDRPRPSALPGLLHGHSFPSGHVFNTTVVWAAIISALASGGAPAAVRRSAAAAAALTVAAVTTHRLYVGQHWLTDAIASGLIVGPWLWSAPRIQSRLVFPLRPVRLATALALPFLLVHASALKIPLPAANREPFAPAFMIELGKPAARPFLRGAWSEDGREPAGTLNWILGTEAALTLPLARRPYRLRFVARPLQLPGAKVCTEMDLRLNGTRLRRQLMYNGWREYHARVPERLIGTGRSLLTIHIDRLPDGTRLPAGGRSAAFLFVAAEETPARVAPP